MNLTNDAKRIKFKTMLNCSVIVCPWSAFVG